MADQTDRDEQPNLEYLALPVAGLALGFGVVSLYWSFGWAGAECLNCDLARAGFNGIDNLGLLPAADYSIGIVVFGVLIMISLNLFAWRRTGGY